MQKCLRPDDPRPRIRAFWKFSDEEAFLDLAMLLRLPPDQRSLLLFSDLRTMNAGNSCMTLTLSSI